VLAIYLEIRKRLGDSAPNLLMVGSPLKPLTPGVHFLRDITDDVLLDLYRNAVLLLFPSLYEGFGWPVVEAQACGCPTVITGTAPLTEAGGKAAVWIDDPQDIQQAADKVMEVFLADDAERRQRQRAGYQNARRFSRQKMAAQYQAIYASLLSE